MYWNTGKNDDDAYLKALKAEIDRREKAPEPDRAVKTRRAEYALDRENLSERVPLHALELKKRDLLNVRRYFPEGFKDADIEYLRELKKLIKLQKYNSQRHRLYVTLGWICSLPRTTAARNSTRPAAKAATGIDGARQGTG